MIINSYRAEDVYDHSTGSEYVENVGTVDQPAEETELYSAEERNGVSAEVTEVAEDIECSTSEICYKVSNSNDNLADKTQDNSAEETGKAAAKKTTEDPSRGVENCLGEEREVGADEETSEYSSMLDCKEEITLEIKEKILEDSVQETSVGSVEESEDLAEETIKAAANETTGDSVEELEYGLGEERDTLDYFAIEDIRDEITISIEIKEETFEAVSVYESPKDIGILGIS